MALGKEYNGICWFPLHCIVKFDDTLKKSVRKSEIALRRLFYAFFSRCRYQKTARIKLNNVVLHSFWISLMTNVKALFVAPTKQAKPRKFTIIVY